MHSIVDYEFSEGTNKLRTSEFWIFRHFKILGFSDFESDSFGRRIGGFLVIAISAKQKDSLDRLKVKVFSRKVFSSWNSDISEFREVTWLLLILQGFVGYNYNKLLSKILETKS